MPLSLLIREAGRTPLPVPEVMFRFAIGRFGLPRLPRGALEHVKYPVVMDGSAFADATGFCHRRSADETIADYRDA
jgi:UDP-glucose 4-epimerase